MYWFTTELEIDGALSRALVADLPIGQPNGLEDLIEAIYDIVRSVDRLGAIFIRLPVKHSLDQSIVKKVFANLGPAPEIEQGRYKCLDQFTESPSKAFRRLKMSSIHLLYSDRFEHIISENINPILAPGANITVSGREGTILETLQRSEFDHLLDLGTCLYPPLHEGAYRAPSGRYVRSYIRVGNLQTSRNAIDAVFFWALPYLQDCTGIVSDTWTISSITQAISRRLAVYLDPAPPIPVEMLPKYHDDAEAFGTQAGRMIANLIGRIENGESGRALVLVSATHTGSLHNHLERHLRKNGLEDGDVHFVAIFKLGKFSSMPSLRDYSENPIFEPIAEDGHAFVIDIDGKNHVPTPEHCTEVMFKVDYVESLVERLSAYEDLPWIRVHFTDRTTQPSQTHHMIWVDINPLLESEVFQERLNEKIDALDPPPKLIVHPPLERANKLADLVVKRLKLKGVDVESCPHDSYDLDDESAVGTTLARAKLATMGEGDAVLFLDDAFITGSRVTIYQLNARTDGFAGSYHYLAAVARPDGIMDWKKAERAFLRSGQGKPENTSFGSVEFVILPNWGRDRCSWCKETELAYRHGDNQGREFRNLEDAASRGIINDLFHSPEGSAKFKLKSGSFFGSEDIPNANLFAIVASSIQYLRSDPTRNSAKLGDDYALVRTVLGHSCIDSYFTDAALIASLFRAARPRELNHPRLEANKKFLSFIKKRGLQVSHGDLTHEVKIAQALGKVRPT